MKNLTVIDDHIFDMFLQLDRIIHDIMSTNTWITENDNFFENLRSTLQTKGANLWAFGCIYNATNIRHISSHLPERNGLPHSADLQGEEETGTWKASDAWR